MNERMKKLDEDFMNMEMDVGKINSKNNGVDDDGVKRTTKTFSS